MNRILYLLISFALFGGSALPASVRACIIPFVIDVAPRFPPPEGMTDPAAVARWTAEREAFALAYEAVEIEQRVSQHRMNLAAYASEVAAMDKADLAEALAVNLTPPLEAAFARRNDCDDIYGPLILDPEGYLADDLADVAIARGVFKDKGDADHIPRRWERRSMADRAFPPCVIEARTAVSDHLARRFSHTELASALSAIRFNGFDRVTTDNARAANRKPNSFRLLKFSEGRSGRLE